jgi:hypothetical protein
MNPTPVDPSNPQTSLPTNPSAGNTSQSAQSGNVVDQTNPIYTNLKLVQALDLDCENGFRWQKDVLNVANSKRIKVCLDEEHPDTAGDSLAMSLLTEKIPDVWVDRALDMPNAKQAYDWLLRKFTGGFNEELMRKWSKVLDYGRINDGLDYHAYVARKFRLARGLQANNHPCSDGRLKMGIVEGLPKQFDHAKSNLYTSCLGQDEDKVTLNIQTCSRLLGIDEFKAPSPSANIANPVRPPPRPRNAPGSRPQGMPEDLPDNFRGCWHCLEDGHSRTVCPKLLAEKERRAALIAAHKNQANPVGGIALGDSSDSGNPFSRWVVDSGPSTHICNDVRLMQNIHWYTQPKGLNLATGEHVAQRKACGSVCLVDERGNVCKLKNVEYVPTAIENLLSVSSAVTDGIIFSNNSHGEIISMSSNTSRFTSEVKKERGLYFVYCLCCKIQSSHSVGYAHKCSEYDLWHQRLGHQGSKNLERLQTEDMVKGISTSLSPCLHGHSLCDVCVMGKQIRESYQ